MSNESKILEMVLSGKQDANIKFSDLQKLLKMLGFSCRVKGDHFIYTKPNMIEIINIQPNGNKAKPYQVKQIRNLLIKNLMEGKDV
ncbi:MAG: type II toxin-antitoxin system HicA family toxin [Eubacterium sp.]|nr:type II toxin-antitoxin system HicA family toxin [Eubacterium sp.]